MSLGDPSWHLEKKIVKHLTWTFFAHVAQLLMLCGTFSRQNNRLKDIQHVKYGRGTNSIMLVASLRSLLRYDFFYRHQEPLDHVLISSLQPSFPMPGFLYIDDCAQDFFKLSFGVTEFNLSWILKTSVATIHKLHLRNIRITNFLDSNECKETYFDLFLIDAYFPVARRRSVYFTHSIGRLSATIRVDTENFVWCLNSSPDQRFKFVNS